MQSSLSRTGLNFVRRWWSRPCGAREVLSIAVPLVISTASWTIMNFIDRMFLLWYSADAMAAAMPAGVLNFFFMCFPLGLALYVNTFVAQYYGAARHDRIGLAVWQGLRIGLYSIPVFLMAIPAAPYIFRLAGHEPQVAVLETLCFQVLTFAGGGVVFSAALSSFFVGRGATRVIMVVNTSASLLNIVLDYLLIFGNLGFPEMGIEGAAWATVVSQWSKVAVYFYLYLQPEYREQYQTATGRRFDAALMKRLLRYGAPSALQLFVGVGAFTIFLLLVGQLGREAMAATTLAFNIESMAFVPMIGVGMAVSTLVGQQLGADRPRLAARATWTSFVLAATYMGTFAVLYLSIPDVFLLGHKAGADPAEFARIRDMTVVLLRFVAVYCLFDAMNIIFCSAIKGAGDTLFVLAVTIVWSPLPVLIGWLGMRHFGWGLYWCWLVITVWICTLGLVYLSRFVQGKWRTMRVVEPDLTVEPVETAVPASEPLASALPGTVVLPD